MDAVLLCLTGQHDPRLVLTAAAVSLLSSLAVFDLRARIAGRDGRIRLAWLAATAFVAGLGIWATHFIAMLAYVPGAILDFAVPMTAASGLLGVLLAGVAFALAAWPGRSGKAQGGRKLLLSAAGGAVLGGGIAVLHYVGMAATVFLGTVAWDGALVAWSVALGCLFGAASFVLAATGPEGSVRHRAAAALALTLAVCLHHFTGMAAVGIQAAAGMAGVSEGTPHTWLVAAVVASTAAVLGFGVLGVAFDRAVERRALREARLRLAQRAGGVATWEWLPASGTIAWSEAMPVLLGIPDDRRPSLDAFFQAVHPEDRAGLRCRMDEALRGETSYDAEFRIVRGGDGAVRWLAGRGEVLRDEAGRAARLVGVNYDVTERREAAEALARLNAELEQRVAERTAQLVQLQKIESLGQMAGGVAHDFNNLLGIVAGNLDLARRRAADPAAVRRYLDNAQQGVDRGAALTRRMLAFARKQDLAPETVDLGAAAAGFAPMLERALGSGVQLRLRCPAGLPPALVDANQFELALLNLAVNARDAMADGGGTVTVAVTAEDVDAAGGGPDGLAAGHYVKVAVADTGQGMDEATLRRATEPFFTTKGVGQGTGLGLSMVHGLCAQSGGRLVLRSAPGQGTTAEMWLPAAEAMAAGGTAAAGTSAAAEAPAAPAAGDASAAAVSAVPAAA